MEEELNLINTPIELYHDIFGSVLDRTELTPYLLRNCSNFQTAIEKTTMMLGNRGFLVSDGELANGELARLSEDINQAIFYFTKWLRPLAKEHLQQLSSLSNERTGFLQNCSN